MDGYYIMVPQQLGLFPGKWQLEHKTLHKIILTLHMLAYTLMYSYMMWTVIDEIESADVTTYLELIVLITEFSYTAPFIFIVNMFYADKCIEVMKLFNNVDYNFRQFYKIDLKERPSFYGLKCVIIMIVLPVAYYSAEGYFRDPTILMGIIRVMLSYIEYILIVFTLTVLDDLLIRWKKLAYIIECLPLQTHEPNVLKLISIQKQLYAIYIPVKACLGPYLCLYVLTNHLVILLDFTALLSSNSQTMSYLNFISDFLYFAIWICFILKCSRLTKTAKRVTENCYLQISQLVTKNSPKVNSKSFDDLTQLKDLSAGLVPEFNAAGFFVIEFASALMLINMLAPYMLLFVQINPPAEDGQTASNNSEHH